jgi:hypothetical protein
MNTLPIHQVLENGKYFTMRSLKSVFSDPKPQTTKNTPLKYKMKYKIHSRFLNVHEKQYRDHRTNKYSFTAYTCNGKDVEKDGEYFWFIEDLFEEYELCALNYDAFIAEPLPKTIRDQTFQIIVESATMRVIGMAVNPKSFIKEWEKQNFKIVSENGNEAVYKNRNGKTILLKHRVKLFETNYETAKIKKGQIVECPDDVK